MQSVNWSRQVNQFLVSIFQSKIPNHPPTNNQPNILSVSLPKPINQPPTSSAKRGAAIHAVSQDKSVIWVSILTSQSTKPPTNQQSATFCQSLCQNQSTNHRPAKQRGEPPAMQSVKTSQSFESGFWRHKAPSHPPTNSQPHSVSLFAKTNQPTTDQLSKEGSRQPCSQSRQVSHFSLDFEFKNTKQPTNQQSANILSVSLPIPIN